MFFVSGITGKIGGAAVQRLLNAGQSVRALVRDPQKADEWVQKGVEVRAGDLTDAKALASALEGVEGAFLIQPTLMGVSREFPEAHALNASFVAALRQTPPPRLVVLSSVGSEQTGGLGNITQTHLLETQLKDLPFPTAFVRAGALLENNLGALGRAKETGWFDSFLQPTDRPFPMVATDDVGAEIARLLIEGWQGQRIVEVGTLTAPDEIARALTEVLQTPVKARPLPREQWGQTLQYMGLAGEQIGNWEEMQDGFNSGWIHFGVPGTETVPGTTSPAQVFARAKAKQNDG